jgi:hypothetical protein
MSSVIANMNARDRAVELVECGLIDAKTMLIACLFYMSLDDVEDMLHTNSFEEEIDYE